MYTDVKPRDNKNDIFRAKHNVNYIPHRNGGLSSVRSRSVLPGDEHSPQSRTPQVDPSRTCLPEIDTKLNDNEINLWKLKEKIKREQRLKELNEWAKGYVTADLPQDHKASSISLVSKKRHRQNHSTMITNNADFIFQVKENYIERVNDEAARKLQNLFRCFLVRAKFLKMRKLIRKNVVKLQTFIRMYLVRKKFLNAINSTKFNAATII